MVRGGSTMEELSVTVGQSFMRLRTAALLLHHMDHPAIIENALKWARDFENLQVRREVRAAFDKFKVPLTVRSAFGQALYELHEAGVPIDEIEAAITNPSAS
jgi:hypothetical protein